MKIINKVQVSGMVNWYPRYHPGLKPQSRMCELYLLLGDKEYNKGFINVITFGDNADYAKDLKEQDKVLIDGYIQQSEWEDKARNRTHIETQIIARRILKIEDKTNG